MKDKMFGKNLNQLEVKASEDSSFICLLVLSSGIKGAPTLGRGFKRGKPCSLDSGNVTATLHNIKANIIDQECRKPNKSAIVPYE